MEEQQLPQNLPMGLRLELARNYQVSVIKHTENGYIVEYFKLSQGVLFPSVKMFNKINQACDFIVQTELAFQQQVAASSPIIKPDFRVVMDPNNPNKKK